MQCGEGGSGWSCDQKKKGVSLTNSIKMMDYLVTMHCYDHVCKVGSKHDKKDDDESPERVSETETIVLYITMVLLIILHAAAIVDAALGKNTSQTYDADIVVSIVSPIMYWILRFFRKLGRIRSNSS